MKSRSSFIRKSGVCMCNPYHFCELNQDFCLTNVRVGSLIFIYFSNVYTECYKNHDLLFKLTVEKKE